MTYSENVLAERMELLRVRSNIDKRLRELDTMMGGGKGRRILVRDRISHSKELSVHVVEENGDICLASGFGGAFLSRDVAALGVLWKP